MKNTPDKIEWLPCPWCGKMPVITSMENDFWLLAHVCRVFSFLDAEDRDLQNLSKRWNTRNP